MATGWSEIVGSALTVIDDERLNEQLTISPAMFYRRMSSYVGFAVSMLNRPPEMLEMLKRSRADPVYDDAIWISTDASVAEETVVNTGKTGYQLFSAVIRLNSPKGGADFAPYAAAVYDPLTGDVTFPKQQKAGVEYILDFYNDGSFDDLSASQLRLFGMAIAVVWDERFERTWLNITPKVHDSTFDTVNEGNYMEKGSQRLQRNVAAFHDALRHYEQDCAYGSYVTEGKPKRLV